MTTPVRWTLALLAALALHALVAGALHLLAARPGSHLGPLAPAAPAAPAPGGAGR